jgi:hypothetical protein
MWRHAILFAFSIIYCHGLVHKISLRHERVFKPNAFFNARQAKLAGIENLLQPDQVNYWLFLYEPL